MCDDGKMYMRWDTGLEHSDKWVELPPVPQDEPVQRCGSCKHVASENGIVICGISKSTYRAVNPDVNCAPYWCPGWETVE